MNETFRISDSLRAAAKETARNLRDEDDKIYLDAPFTGFYVTRRRPAEVFAEGDGFFIGCEDLFGKKSEDTAI